MNEIDRKKKSKFLSYVLRHRPGKIGIDLDGHGWVDVEDLLAAICASGPAISREQLEEIVATNDKQRFSFSDDGRRIRANQGHSIEVDLAPQKQAPPNQLFHGTVRKSMDSIREKGLMKGNRHHVHLSPDRETASKVGQRRGKPVILTIDAARMHADGYVFYLSANGVWLTDHVPLEYITDPINALPDLGSN